MGEAKWYLGMRITQKKNYTSLPETIHFRALLHLIGFLKNTSYKGLKFFSDFKCSNVYKLLINNNMKTTEDSVIIFSDSKKEDDTTK